MPFMLSEDGLPVAIPEPFKLQFIVDFVEGLKVVQELLQTNLVFLALLAGMPAIYVICKLVRFDLMFLGLGMELATIWVSASVIALAYSKFHPSFKVADLAPGAEKRVYSASVAVGLKTILYGLLFILPGVWFALNSCLATVYACLEGSHAGQSIKKSEALVGKNRFTTFVYLMLQPSLVWLGIFAAFVALRCLTNIMGTLGEKVSCVNEGLYLFVNSIFQLIISTLMVRLYVFLTGGAQLPASPAVSEPGSSSMRISSEDASRMPHW